MQFNTTDRVRVARVRLVRDRRLQEIAGCWISINAERDRLGIWLDPHRPVPSLTVPLGDAQIDWQEAEASGSTPMPMPTP